MAKTNILNVQENYKIVSTNGNVYIQTSPGESAPDGSSTSTKTIIVSTSNVWNPRIDITPDTGRLYDPEDVYGAEELDSIALANEQREKGAFYIAGGVGIQKDLNVGGYIYGRIDYSFTTTNVEFTNTNIDQEFQLTFIEKFESLESSSPIYIDREGVEDGLTYNPEKGRITTDRALIAETDNSVSTQTGALVVNGGVGIAKDVVIGGDVYPEEDLTGQIGSTGTQWAEAYVHDIYTRVIRSTTGTVQIAPAAAVTEIIGDIRVRGTNPIGTAPVVTNVLYVTMDGNDTNDGRAMDPSRACRTISGVLNSPYYQPGTQIRVSAGFYLEDNPLPLKPYTSIVGSDIRTTFIEPINKTQDLFHLNSGCYLNYMTFLNGRSGLLPGEYEDQYNRGAYATAFPPLPVGERIDLYHSPYIQNCTNQSGPWLRDGTMFVPNQTVQVPQAVGVGSWPAGTTTIVVNIEGQGIVKQGQSINAGQQNSGFFDARTLMLSNKRFLQEQVVAYVDDTFSNTTFTYDSEKCARDVGLIIDSISIDLLQNSDSDSIFAGLQYWRQSGYVDAVNEQITETLDAIEFVKDAAATIASPFGVSSVVGERFDNIITILNTSSETLATGEFAEWITNSIISNGTATNETNVIDAFNALIAAKDSIAEDTIEHINSQLTPFEYDQAKCSRDTGFIIDAIAQDLLFEGNSQSTFAGLQYWNQTGFVGSIADEITTTTNTIQYVKELAQKIILGDVTGTRYQTAVKQNTRYSTATSVESAIIGADFNVILDILTNSPAGVSDVIVPNGIVASNDVNVNRAYTLLQVNELYIIAEAIAFVEATKTPGFDYDQTKCRRDVGYMLDSVSFDLLYGGNKQAVQSGVYYYGYDAGSSAIENEIPQTTAAYNYIRKLAAQIVRGIKIPEGTLKQSLPLAVPQILSTSIATPIEVDEINKRIDLILDIINNGPSVAGPLEPISLNKSQSVYNEFAAQLLKLNRQFIKNEVIAYVNTLYEFMYDEDKCRRDVGYMIDSVAFDLLHGGNKQSIKSGVYYYGYSSDTTEIPGEIPQTTAAYSFIKAILPSIVKAELITSPNQSVTTQTTNLSFATDTEVKLLQSKIDTITSIIRNGPAGVVREPIHLDQSDSSNVLNAYRLLEANKEFIKAEVIAYIDNFNSFDYSREFCFRDVGILVENIAYDATFGGNEKSIDSGLAYYDGVVSIISGQEVQTTAAIDYLNKMVQSIIVNNTWTNILVPPEEVVPSGVPTTQLRNTVLTGGFVASRAISDLFNEVINIIENGPSAASKKYIGTNVDAAYVSAEVLMQANRKFIQEDTINYINNLVQEFPYSEVKCRRDTGLIIDSIALDLLYPTPDNSQSTFAGLQYWNQNNYIGEIESQLDPTVKAMEYLKSLAVKIVQNITPADDLVTRYQSTVTQITNLESATVAEADAIKVNFNTIITIVNGSYSGWTDRIIPNGKQSPFLNVKNAVNLLLANKNYLGHEVTAFVDATNSNFNYDPEKCRRDVGYIVNAVAFDLLHGGNRQSVQAGLYYYGFDESNTTIRNQEIQTTAAFNYLATLTSKVVKGEPVERLQHKIDQVYGSQFATEFEVEALVAAINTITNIITNGPDVASTSTGITFDASTTATVMTAYDLLYANKAFMVEEVIAYIDKTYNPESFNYDEALCFRDIGLIVDAVSQDVLTNGNYKSIEAGLAYWNYGVSHVIGQETTTTVAMNYARDLSLQVIANMPVAAQTSTITKQIINPFFQYGGDYMPQQAVRRGFDTVTDIINRGPEYAPPKYMGGGLFAAVGINGSDVLNSPKVVSVNTLSNGSYLIGLDIATVGFGNNATLYFGDVLTIPKQDKEVDQLCLEYGVPIGTWNQRKTDPIGSMGGSLVDGGVISSRSPIQSFVYDAFTQLTQGGRGVRITNDGYAQLVSVFTIFSSVGVQTDNGGIASIVNSNANFGDICLQAKGYGKRKFSGQIYNPPFRAYPESPGEDGFDQYYPSGFWPNQAQVAVYMPELDDRPHISLVMEVIPPDEYTGNEQSRPDATGGLPPHPFKGFLNASPTTSTLTKGSITLTGISTDNIAIGNELYIRDQFGYQYDQFPYLHDPDGNPIDALGNITTAELAPPNPNFGIWYASTGTFVTDLEFDKITISQSLKSEGGDPNNQNYFDLYFCGNSYYTVLSSEIIDNPKYSTGTTLIPPGVNILSTEATGSDISQVPAHVATLQYLNSLTVSVISNTPVVSLQTGENSSTQAISVLVRGGEAAQSFIDLRFGEIIDIVNAPDLLAAENIIRPSQRTTEGPEVQGASAAISLINSNIEFLADEVTEFVDINFGSNSFTYDEAKCSRDAGYILDGAYYDAAIGSNWNGVYSGIAYSRSVSSIVVDSQLNQTVGALNFLQDRALLAVAGSPVAYTRIEASFYETINVLSEGAGAADELVFPTPANILESDDRVKAKNVLVANKNFMKAEIIAWINEQIVTNNGSFAGFVYNQATCARDVGYIIDALCYDILYGGNSASFISARAYFEGAVSVIPGETTQTIEAINRLSEIAQDIIKGIAITVSPENILQQNTTQASIALTDEADRVNDELLSIITTAISNGAAPNEGDLTRPNIDWVSSEIQDAVNTLADNKNDIIVGMINFINDEYVGEFTYDKAQCRRDIKTILQRLIYDIESGGRYNSVLCGLAYWNRTGTYHRVSLGENVTRPDLFPHNATVNFYQRSYMSASGYVFEYVGAGTNYGALPQRGRADPVQARETVQLNSGKVFFTSTDQNGDFRIGPGLVISQATGVLSGRTFTRSLFANLTPFILAIESGS